MATSLGNARYFIIPLIPPVLFPQGQVTFSAVKRPFKNAVMKRLTLSQLPFHVESPALSNYLGLDEWM